MAALSSAYRLAWWSCVLLAFVGPLSLVEKVGVAETWEAFGRYQRLVLRLGQDHPIRVPEQLQAGGTQSLLQLDEDLISWNGNMSAVFDRISRMAVVGLVSSGGSGIPVEFEFAEPGGTGASPRFKPQRDLSLLLYLGLSAAVYFVDSVPLAAIVLNLNLYNIAICLRLKGLSDAIDAAVDTLADSQQALLLLPAPHDALDVQLHQLCLLKLAALVASWSDRELGMSITLPGGSGMTSSVSLMATLAAATTARCAHVIVYGFYPGLPRLFSRRVLRRGLLGIRSTRSLRVDGPPGGPGGVDAKED